MNIPGIRSEYPRWIMVPVLVLPFLLSARALPDDDERVTFDDHVRSIFLQRCGACHNSDRKSAGLDLTNYTNMMQGGSSGEAIEPGDAAGSYLFQLVTHEGSPEMPPDGTRIPEPEIRTIENWINRGALENRGSVATIRKKKIVAAGAVVGVRPDNVARPLRLTLEPAFIAPRAGVVRSMAVSPWTTLAALSAAKQILLYDTASREFLGALPFPEGQANVIRFSRNGQLLLAGGGRHGLSGKVVVWDVLSGQRVIEVGSELDNVLAADISADQTRIALGGPQKMVRVFSAVTGTLLYEIKKHTDWITAVEFSPDGVLLASADRNGGLHLWEAQTGNEYLSLAGHDGSVRSISWRQDANVLATGGDDAQVRLWEVENGGLLKSWKADRGRVSDLTFRRNGQLVTCGQEPAVKAWQQNGTLIRQYGGLQDLGVAVAACDEAGVVLAAELSGRVRLWKADDGETLGQITSNPPSLSVRLQRAQQKLVEVQSLLAPLERKLATAERQLAELTASINDQRETRDRFAADATQLRARSETIDSQIENLAQQRADWQQELQATEAALLPMTEAVDRAIAASERLPNDRELESLVASLTSSRDRFQKRVLDLNNQIEASVEDELGRQAERKQLRQQIEQTTSNLNGADTTLNQLSGQLPPREAAVRKLQDEAQAARDRKRQIEAEVARWQEEIEFDKRLQQLIQSWQEAQHRVQQDELVVESAAQRLEEAKAEYQQRLDAKKRSEQLAAEMLEQLRQLRDRD